MPKENTLKPCMMPACLLYALVTLFLYHFTMKHPILEKSVQQQHRVEKSSPQGRINSPLLLFSLSCAYQQLFGLVLPILPGSTHLL